MIHSYTIIQTYVCNTYIHMCIVVGNDYESGPFNITIPAGETRATFSIPIINNNIFEDNETFTLTIDPSSLPSRVHQQMNCLLVVTIVDDDSEFD